MAFTLPTSGTNLKVATKGQLEAAINSAIEAAVTLPRVTAAIGTAPVKGAPVRADKIAIKDSAAAGALALADLAKLPMTDAVLAALDALDATFATTAQGAKADTAVQPGGAGAASDGNRPGRAMAAWVTATAGAPGALTGLDGDPAITSGSVAGLGECAIITAADRTISRREAFPVHPGRVYLAYFVARRVVNTADISGAGMRFGLARLGEDYSAIGNTVLSDRTPSVTTGIIRAAYTFSVGTPPLGNVDAMLADTVYVRQYVRSYGEDKSDAIAQMQILDVTEAASIEGALDAVALSQAVLYAEAAAQAALDAEAGAAQAALDAEAAAAQVAQRRPFVMLALGQSNMRSNESSTGGDMSTPLPIFVWNGNETAVGSAYTQPVVGEYPLDTYNAGVGEYANNMAYAAARRANEMTGRPVYLILYAKGAHPIEAFIKPATLTANSWTLGGTFTDLTTYMYPGIANALAAIPGSPAVADAMLWMQGEANTADTAAVYRNKFVTGVLGDLSAAGLIEGEETTIVAGALLDTPSNKPFRQYHREVMLDSRNTWPTLRYVPADKLPVGSGAHYTGRGLVVMGEGMAAEALSAIHECPGYTVDGSWSPVLADAVTAGNVATATSTSALYNARREMIYDAGTMRPLGIGGLVTATCRIVNIDTTGMTPGNAIYLRGLPFLHRNGGPSIVFSGVEAENIAFGSYLTVRTNIFSPILKFRKNTPSAILVDLKVSDLTSGTADLALTISYWAQVSTFADGSA